MQHSCRGWVACLCLAASVTARGDPRGIRVQGLLGADASIPAYHALIIGINAYAHWPALRHAREDAESLAALLQRGYGFDHVCALYDGQATREAILDKLYDISRTLGPSDALLIYYAGHGYFDRQLDNGYWIPADGPEPADNKPNVAGWIQDVTLKDVLCKTKARHVLVLSDACFGGALLRGGLVNLAARENAYYRTAISQPTRWCITSGDLEQVPDESVFSQKILQVLQYPKQRVFAASDVANWIKADVAEFTGKQLRFGPLRTVSSSDTGEFVFLSAERSVRTNVVANLAAASVPTPPAAAPAVGQQTTGDKGPWWKQPWAWIGGAALAVGVAAVASGGGGDGGGDVNVVGQWQLVAFTGTSSPSDLPPTVVFLPNGTLGMPSSGATAGAMSATYSVSGDRISFTVGVETGAKPPQSVTIRGAGVVSGNTMQGTWTASDGSSGTFTMTRL